jgi:hypothetical protein
MPFMKLGRSVDRLKLRKAVRGKRFVYRGPRHYLATSRLGYWTKLRFTEKIDFTPKFVNTTMARFARRPLAYRRVPGARARRAERRGMLWGNAAVGLPRDQRSAWVCRR